MLKNIYSGNLDKIEKKVMNASHYLETGESNKTKNDNDEK